MGTLSLYTLADALPANAGATPLSPSELRRMGYNIDGANDPDQASAKREMLLQQLEERVARQPRGAGTSVTLEDSTPRESGWLELRDWKPGLERKNSSGSESGFSGLLSANERPFWSGRVERATTIGTLLPGSEATLKSLSADALPQMPPLPPKDAAGGGLFLEDKNGDGGIDIDEFKTAMRTGTDLAA